MNLDNLQNYTIWCDNTDLNGTHTISGDSTPVLNVWYNCIETYDGTNLKIYLNGQLRNSIPYSINLNNNLHILTIGSQNVTSNTNDFFSGKLDDIGIWNRSLTSTEVQQLYTGISPCSFYDTIHTSVVDTLIINTTLTGIKPPNNTNTFKVYPNPTHDHVEINTGNYSKMSGYTIEITNTFGQVLFQNLIDQQTFDVSLSSWVKGTYMIKILNTQNSVIEVKEIVLQ